MWSDVLKPSLRQRVCGALGSDDAAAAKWVSFWVGAHDIGKLSPAFQRKVPEKFCELTKIGLSFPQGNTPHGTVSTLILDDLLAKETAWPKIHQDLARKLAVAIGGHHGVFPTTAQWDGAECHCSLGDARWGEARRRMLGWLARRLGVESLAAPECPPATDHATFMIIAGLTSVADWIGSNTAFFLPAGDDVDLEKYSLGSDRRARSALGDLGWTGWHGCADDWTFRELFGFEPRGLQVESIKQAAGLTRPGLVLIEAPMGEGKTEAALYLADHWGRVLGQQGIYVALPTQATSNQMFGRVERFLEHRYPLDRVNLHLLHGQATLSDQYEKLRLAAIYDDDNAPGKVVAESWFAANKKQAMLAPFGVGTIDQSLLSVLQTKHVFVRLFALAGKTIILDEVHAYDAYMSTILERLLNWLSALGSSAVLLSATLPAEKRRSLFKAWDAKAADPPPVSYPRMTVLAGSQTPEVARIPVAPDRWMRVGVRWVSPSGVAAGLRSALHHGGCAAVIVNTVGEAQRAYLELRNALRDDGVEVELFHARFPFGQRQEIESGILARFGKAEDGKPENTKRPSKSVLVATQVIEQSLDIDFDLMVSAVAPVDLVLQRAGRLHRHDRARPKGLAAPELWLLEPDASAAVPKFGNTERIYERLVLLRSFLVLRRHNSLTPVSQMDDLIEAVYGNDPQRWAVPPDEPWRIELDASLAKLREREERAKLKAADCLLKRPTLRRGVLDNWQEIEDEDDAAEQQLHALTRDARESVSLVLLHDTASGPAFDVAGASPVDLHRTPTERAEVNKILCRTVSITHWPCVQAFRGELFAPKGWRENGILRRHRVAVLGDELSIPFLGYSRGVAVPYTLRLDEKLGVVIDRDEQLTTEE
jgi:CRISPR-associated endonuclease/helicase Cas3